MIDIRFVDLVLDSNDFPSPFYHAINTKGVGAQGGGRTSPDPSNHAINTKGVGAQGGGRTAEGAI